MGVRTASSASCFSVSMMERGVILCRASSLHVGQKKQLSAIELLKGLSHEMDLAFDDVWLVLGLNKGRGHFLNFSVQKCISPEFTVCVGQENNNYQR